jgi:hypothetical protein
MTKSKKAKAKNPQHAERKKAFDTVLETYRNAKDTGIGAVAISGGGKAVSNPARPSFIDFRCDVDRVINKCIPVAHTEIRIRFRAAYIDFDCTDYIEMEVHADRTMKMGLGRHNLEEGIGAEFKKRDIYPIKKYFHTVRKSRSV